METLYLKAFSPHLRPGMLKSAFTGLQDYGVHLPLNSGHVTYFSWKFLQSLILELASPAITQYNILKAVRQTVKCVSAEVPFLVSNSGISIGMGRLATWSPHVTENFQGLTKKEGKSISFLSYFPLKKIFLSIIMIGLPCNLIFLFCFSSEDLSLPFVCQTNLSHPVLNFLIAHVILKNSLLRLYSKVFKPRKHRYLSVNNSSFIINLVWFRPGVLKLECASESHRGLLKLRGSTLGELGCGTKICMPYRFQPIQMFLVQGSHLENHWLRQRCEQPLLQLVCRDRSAIFNFYLGFWFIALLSRCPTWGIWRLG